MNIRVEPPVEAGRDTWHTARRWLAEHGQIALATVVSTWGSAPVPAGGQLVIAPGERFEGSVSGGCVEVDVLVEAADVMAAGKPKLLEYGVSDEAAWRAGLACGGSIKILVEPLTQADMPFIDAVIAAGAQRKSIVVARRVAGGERQIYMRGEECPAAFAPFFNSGATSLVDTPDGQVVVQPLLPSLRVIVAGATHIGQVFADMARLVGYSVMVVDPRPMFATEERFNGAVVMPQWPETFGELGLDERTAVVALTHASHIDDVALIAALGSPCMYIGALGSRGTNAKRIERLKAAGFSEDELARIHAPIGLNIGAKGPAEIAVSILAEIVKVARGAG